MYNLYIGACVGWPIIDESINEHNNDNKSFKVIKEKNLKLDDINLSCDNYKEVDNNDFPIKNSIPIDDSSSNNVDIVVTIIGEEKDVEDDKRLQENLNELNQNEQKSHTKVDENESQIYISDDLDININENLNSADNENLNNFVNENLDNAVNKNLNNVVNENLDHDVSKGSNDNVNEDLYYNINENLDNNTNENKNYYVHLNNHLENDVEIFMDHINNGNFITNKLNNYTYLELNIGNHNNSNDASKMNDMNKNDKFDESMANNFETYLNKQSQDNTNDDDLFDTIKDDYSIGSKKIKNDIHIQKNHKININSINQKNDLDIQNTDIQKINDYSPKSHVHSNDTFNVIEGLKVKVDNNNIKHIERNLTLNHTLDDLLNTNEQIDDAIKTNSEISHDMINTQIGFDNSDDEYREVFEFKINNKNIFSEEEKSENNIKPLINDNLTIYYNQRNGVKSLEDFDKVLNAFKNASKECITNSEIEEVKIQREKLNEIIYDFRSFGPFSTNIETINQVESNQNDFHDENNIEKSLHKILNVPMESTDESLDVEIINLESNLKVDDEEDVDNETKGNKI